MRRAITDMTGIVSVRGRKSFTDSYCLTLRGDAVFGWTTKQAPRFRRWMRKENGLCLIRFLLSTRRICTHRGGNESVLTDMKGLWWDAIQASVPAPQMCEMWFSNGVVYSYSGDQTG